MMLSETNQHTNRTEPIFQGTTNLNTVNLGITTKCSMKCPKCSVGVPKWKADQQDNHASVWMILRDAHFMQGLKRVHITGGEPTLHPDFEEIATNVRRWFRCRYVTIETNGFGYGLHREVFRNPRVFDRVFITHYQKDAIYKGSPDNTEIILAAQHDLGERLIREPPVEHTLQHLAVVNRDMKPVSEEVFECSKWKHPGLPAGWYDGLIYPCCVSVGISRDLGIRVTKNWRLDLQNLVRGCESCLYRGT